MAKYRLNDQLEYLLKDYLDQEGLKRDAVVNQAVKEYLIKKMGKKEIARLLKEEAAEENYSLERLLGTNFDSWLEL